MNIEDFTGFKHLLSAVLKTNTSKYEDPLTWCIIEVPELAPSLLHFGEFLCMEVNEGDQLAVTTGFLNRGLGPT